MLLLVYLLHYLSILCLYLLILSSPSHFSIGTTHVSISSALSLPKSTTTTSNSSHFLMSYPSHNMSSSTQPTLISLSQPISSTSCLPKLSISCSLPPRTTLPIDSTSLCPIAASLSYPSFLLSSSLNTHHMLTRAKHGIHKPKILLTSTITIDLDIGELVSTSLRK